MSVVGGSLPCGRHLEALADLVAERVPVGRGDHEATCPYCRAALAELQRLWGPVRRWAERPVRVPPGFVAAVGRRIRRMTGSPPHVASGEGPGTTTVTSWVLGVVARQAAEATQGVACVSSRSPVAVDGVAVEDRGPVGAAVALGVTADPGVDLRDLGERIRRNVVAAVAEHAGVAVSRVDIRIDDVDIP